MEKRDAKGRTEAEFLAQYRPGNYPRPSFTADVAVFAHDGQGALRLLMIRRGGHPYLGCWALPGGFVNPDEDADAAAARELLEETGVSGLTIEQLGVYSAPGRDPRGWTVSAAYTVCLPDQVDAQAGDDAAETCWCLVRVLRREDGVYEMAVQTGEETLSCVFEALPARYMPARAQVLSADGFAFDHANIIADAWLALQE